MVAKSPSRRDLFHDDRDRRRYLELVEREVRDRKWSVLTFCLMTNHAHLLVQTPSPDLGAGFKRIHEDYARSLNRRHDMSGHAFGARFYSELVRADRHLIGCIRYIARNPVAHGACHRPRDWSWSAHRALAGLADPPGFLDAAAVYSHLGRTGAEARLTYLRLVAQSDNALLSDLARPTSDRWMITAIDAYLIPVPQVAEFLGISVSTAYKRLASARENEGSGPSVSRENEGSGP